MSKEFAIAGREIGLHTRPYVIAEIGVNHDGSIDRALALTNAAADAGADAVKLQYFETDRLMSGASRLAAYQKASGETDPHAMLRRLELTIDEMDRVIECAQSRDIHAIVTVFSTELVAPAKALAWDAFKSASPDIVNRPLLEAMANDGRPLIVSTGASTMDEVARAAAWLSTLPSPIAMLQCVSSYPAPSPALGGITAISHATGLVTGYSDHTPDDTTGAMAVAAGACILEKHLTYDKTAKGPDHAASLEPVELARYVELARRARSLNREINPLELGSVEKRLLDVERDVRSLSRQSLVAAREIREGELVTRDMLTIKRPGTGCAPYRLDELIGSVAARRIEADRPIGRGDVRAA